jgi:hypothetical protein
MTAAAATRGNGSDFNLDHHHSDSYRTKSSAIRLAAATEAVGAIMTSATC